MCGHLEPNVSYLTKGQVDTVSWVGVGGVGGRIYGAK